MTDTLETKAVEILDKVTHAIEAAATPAADALLTAVWFDGVSRVATGIACGVGAYLLGRLIAKRLHKFSTGTDEIPDFMICLIGGIAAVMLTIGTATCLLSAYTWAALFSPSAAIALKILAGIGS